MAKPVVLMIGAYPDWDMAPMEEAYDLRKLWLASDREAFLAATTPEARAIATRGELGASAALDRPLPQARDHRLLRRRLRRHRHQTSEGTRRAGHQHARRPDRGRRRFRLRAHPRPSAQDRRWRRACALGRVEERRAAARRQPKRQDARHPRLWPHRPRHRAAGARFWRDARLLRRRPRRWASTPPTTATPSPWRAPATFSSPPFPAARRRAASSTRRFSTLLAPRASSSMFRAARSSTNRP